MHLIPLYAMLFITAHKPRFSLPPLASGFLFTQEKEAIRITPALIKKNVLGLGYCIDIPVLSTSLSLCTPAGVMWVLSGQNPPLENGA